MSFLLSISRVTGSLYPAQRGHWSRFSEALESVSALVIIKQTTETPLCCSALSEFRWVCLFLEIIQTDPLTSDPLMFKLCSAFLCSCDSGWWHVGDRAATNDSSHYWFIWWLQSKVASSEGFSFTLRVPLKQRKAENPVCRGLLVF